MIATHNSFDYSAFIFTRLTSLIAEGDDAHPQLGKGVPGFWAYSWRGFVDKTDGNYWVIFALPTLLREDEPYYAMGNGSFWKRASYAVSRVAITPDYHGNNTINASELLGRGIAEGISPTYRPSPGPYCRGHRASMAMRAFVTQRRMPFANSGPISPSMSSIGMHNSAHDCHL
jgi:hypothetical protein